MRLKIFEIANLLQTDLVCPAHARSDAVMAGAAIDSRAVKPGNLFVCLPGSRVDGHDYAATAAEVGAGAILASRPLPEIKIPVLIVPDTEKALQHLAAFCRARAKAKVLCLTGTAGKTTLKDTLAAIMRQKGKVAATAGNHNNQIGLPLTILNADGDEDFWIIEAGISHAGDMDLLGGIARPDIAVILNAGPGHTEGLGAEGVAWHKARLLHYLQPHGRALVSADYPNLARACGEYAVKTEFFSCSPQSACNCKLMASGPGWQEMLLNGRPARFQTPLMGAFGAETALAAAAAANMLGANDAEIAAGFAAARLPEQRFRQLSLCNNVILIDDTYNANPLSMRRALACAAEEAQTQGLPFYAVLGAMGELGQEAEACHRELGRQLAELRPAGIIWAGPYGDAVQAGMGSSALQQVKTAAEFAAFWQSHAMPKDNMLVLFKGSRANGLENYIKAFRQTLPNTEDAHVL